MSLLKQNHGRLKIFEAQCSGSASHQQSDRTWSQNKLASERTALFLLFLYFIFIDLKTSRFNLLVSYKYIKKETALPQMPSDSLCLATACIRRQTRPESPRELLLLLLHYWWGCRNEMALILLPYAPRSILIIRSMVTPVIFGFMYYLLRVWIYAVNR